MGLHVNMVRTFICHESMMGAREQQCSPTSCSMAARLAEVMAVCWGIWRHQAGDWDTLGTLAQWYVNDYLSLMIADQVICVSNWSGYGDC